MQHLASMMCGLKSLNKWTNTSKWHTFAYVIDILRNNLWLKLLTVHNRQKKYNQIYSNEQMWTPIIIVFEKKYFIEERWYSVNWWFIISCQLRYMTGRPFPRRSPDERSCLQHDCNVWNASRSRIVVYAQLQPSPIIQPRSYAHIIQLDANIISYVDYDITIMFQFLISFLIFTSFQF